jgi:ABC-type polysaccharide/polyol phosphate transport system ATPase subunit
MGQIVTRNITKRFGDVVALDRVSIDIAPSSIHAILGENGAGKTTLMNILFGLYQPDAGVLGVMQAAREKNVWAFGIYADFYQDYPDVALQSALMDISAAIVEFTKLAKAGKAEGKVYRYGFGSGAASFGTYHPDIPDAVREEVESVIADIESGKIIP